MSLPLHGETVQVTRIAFVLRGYFNEYIATYCFANPDTGKPIYRTLKFDESVAIAFRQAGHPQVKHSFTNEVIDMAHVDVVLGTKTTHRGDSLIITHVMASDGTSHAVESAKAKAHITTERTQPKGAIEEAFKLSLSKVDAELTLVFVTDYGMNFSQIPDVKPRSPFASSPVNFKRVNGGMHVNMLAPRGALFTNTKALVA